MPEGRVFPDAQNPVFWHIFNQNNPQKLISGSSMLPSLVSFLNIEVVLSNRITGSLWVIIACFINNIPITICALHQTPQHQCLLEYLLGRNTARQLGDTIVGKFKILLP